MLTLAIVGAGRLGNTLADALREVGYEVRGPFGRGVDGWSADGGPEGRRADAALLCVPDSEIASAAKRIPPGLLVGHCSGATGLAPLAPHEAFSVHPLMTVTNRGASFRGAAAAIDGSTPRAVRLAEEIAIALGMEPVRIADRDRAAYHAAASIASNFLVALEAAAERLAQTVGLERHELVALVRATVENWAALGPDGALTGPVVRGDHDTVEAQRAAVLERTPELIDLFDAMVELTRGLARSSKERQAKLEPQPA